MEFIMTDASTHLSAHTAVPTPLTAKKAHASQQFRELRVNLITRERTVAEVREVVHTSTTPTGGTTTQSA
jgi:hypothetical protein